MHETHSIVNRLRRIEGQVRGVAKMVEEDRYCIDILHQLEAVKAAVARTESAILKNHTSHCVAEAIASGDSEAQREKFGELIDLLERVRK